MSSLTPLVTVVTPVYNRLEYLGEAIESVFAQASGDWSLLLADDHSGEEVWDRLREYAARDARVSLLRQERNTGLFANLNAALPMVQTPYVLLLCSDDRLKPSAIARLLETAREYPEADLILPAHHIIDPKTPGHGSGIQMAYRRAICSTTRLLERREALELLLRCGSVNGSLTGMFFRRDLFDRAGPFRSDWRQAADWEWLHRVAHAGAIVYSVEALAEIRSHDGQLSAANLRSSIYAREVAATVRGLLSDPELRQHPRARIWARGIMESQVWQATRAAAQGNLRLAAEIFGEVARTTGVTSTFATMILALPARFGARLRGMPRMPQR